MVLENLVSNPIAISGATILGRNVLGWFLNSLKDGQIQSYEWKQLLKTLVSLGGLSVFAYLGIGAVVEGISPTDTTSLVALADLVRSYFKKE